MWIIPSVCGREDLAPLMHACRATAPLCAVTALCDIRVSAAGLPSLPRWRLIPALGPLAAADCVRIARLAGAAEGPIGFLAADHRPLTPAWDAALARAAGQWNIAYCNDLVSAGRHPVGGADRVTGAICIGAGLVREMGEVLPTGMTLADARVAWAALGRALGCLRYLSDVAVEWRPERSGEVRPLPGAEPPERRARLFRWLNDELRPLAARVREARAAAAAPAEATAPAEAMADAACAV